MNSPSPDGPHLPPPGPLPGTAALGLSLVGTHLLSGWWLLDRVGPLGAFVLRRSPRSRVFVGGQHAPSVDAGELDRLLQSLFLHADLLHLLLNLAALVVVGRILEPWVGPVRLLVWFVLSGLGGSVLPHLVGVVQSDGASGGVFGLLTAVVVLAVRGRDQIPDEDRSVLLRAVPLAWLGNLALGFLVPGIDGWAHLGGTVVGGLLALSRPPGTSP